jgi:hypothetical protein
MINMLSWVIEQLAALFLDRRRLRVLVHRAVFTSSGEECFFVNLLHADAYNVARVRLSTGQIVTSKQNPTVPESGSVLGGPIGSRR